MSADRVIDANGYVRIRFGARWVLECRVVAGAVLGRELREDECVRFRDGNPTNATPANVYVVPVGAGILSPTRRRYGRPPKGKLSREDKAHRKRQRLRFYWQARADKILPQRKSA